MPVIVIPRKVLRLSAVWVQTRKTVCDGCGETFVYLASGSQNFETSGTPLFSSDDGMRKTIQSMVEKRFDALSEKPRQGEALCPHCKRYQQWMVTNKRNSRLVYGIGVGVVVALVAGFVGMLFLLDSRSVPAWLPFAALLPIGVALGILWAAKGGLSVGPHSKLNDARAMPEKDYEQHLEECKKRDYNPALAWWAMIGGKFPEKVPIIPLKPYAEDSVFQR